MAAAAEVEGDDTGAEEAPPAHQRSGVAALALGALGIVCGDIGTSPIRALREELAPATAAFLVAEGAFLSANLLKLPDGGCLPVGAALLIGLLMFAWWRGTQLANERMRRDMVRLDRFVRSMGHSSVHVAKGTALFLTSDPEAVPPALLHNLRHNRVLHDQTVILTVEILRVPHLAAAERAEHEALGGISRASSCASASWTRRT